MKQPTEEQLINIAQTHLCIRISTLKERNSDALDFYNVSIWGIEAALKEACQLGIRLASEGND